MRKECPQSTLDAVRKLFERRSKEGHAEPLSGMEVARLLPREGLGHVRLALGRLTRDKVLTGSFGVRGARSRVPLFELRMDSAERAEERAMQRHRENARAMAYMSGQTLQSKPRAFGIRPGAISDDRAAAFVSMSSRVRTGSSSDQIPGSRTPASHLLQSSTQPVGTVSLVADVSMMGRGAGFNPLEDEDDG